MGHFISYWGRALGRKIGQDEIEALNWEDYEAGFNITGAEYLVTLEQVQQFSRKIAHWHHDGGYDLLLTPTLRIPPSRFGNFESTLEEPTKLLDVATSFNPFTRIQNLTGQPPQCPFHYSGTKITCRSACISQAVSETKRHFSNWQPNWNKQGPGLIENHLSIAAAKDIPIRTNPSRRLIQ